MRIVPALVLSALGALPLAAQLTVRATLPDNTVEVSNNGSLAFEATAINQSIPASIQVINTATTTPQINFVRVTGSNDFTISNLTETPFTLQSRGAFGFQLAYRATTSARTTARLVINQTLNNVTSDVIVNLVGTAPEFIFSATPQGGNTSSISSGGTIRFPDTAIDATSTAVVIVTNRGTAPGVFNGASVTGADFASVNVPLAGATVEAGRDVRFTVTFTPKALGASRGSLAVNAGQPTTINLEGTGTGSRLSYLQILNNTPAPLAPNQTINVPDIAVGERSSVVVRVRNEGNADARIAAITATGTGYSLTETPLLPLTVAAGQEFAFTVNFAPTTPGASLGRLRIGSDDFVLSSNGLGASLSYAFIANAVTTPVTANGTAIFTPAPVGGRSSLRFAITNSGTTATTVSSIALGAPSTVFLLANIPPLPVSIAPGDTVSFDVTFAPVALGGSTATLRVDNTSFTLSGTGNSPPPLPTITFDGASGAQQPLQQPAVGLTLASAYPLALTGTLTLSFNSDVFSNDPSVQFATGGRTVSFTIPANSTRAVFANNQNQVRVQTGSVAGVITLTPDISTTEGSIKLTPATPPTANLTVASAAPRLLSVSVGARTAASITLVVSGYATSRSVNQIVIAITPTGGESVSTQSITVPVEGAFLGWYQSNPSAAFGSLFSATIPLTFSGEVTNVTNLSDTLQSVSVTASNAQGASNAVQLTLR